jgi:tetratricopeptide (TPR) repeat protein
MLMVQCVRKYNLALELIASEDLEAARQLLESIVQENPAQPLFHQTLGYAEIVTGYLHRGLQRLKGLQQIQAVEIQEIIQQTEELLPVFDEIYTLYNRSLHRIEQENFPEAVALFGQILSYQVNVPVHFYSAYISLLALQDRKEEALSVIASLPAYAKHSEQIRYIQSELDVEAAAKKQTRLKRVSIVMSALASVLVVGMVSQFYFKSNQISAPVIQPAVVIGTYAQELELAELKKKVSFLEDERRGLENHLVDLQENKEEWERLHRAMDVANLKEEKITVTAAMNAYKKGLQLFQNSEYQGAAQSLQESLAFSDQSYFSDDSLFYYMMSNRRMGLKAEAEQALDKFLVQGVESFGKEREGFRREHIA